LTCGLVRSNFSLAIFNSRKEFHMLRRAQTDTDF